MIHLYKGVVHEKIIASINLALGCVKYTPKQITDVAKIINRKNLAGGESLSCKQFLANI
jgi:hypothetical protein